MIYIPSDKSSTKSLPIEQMDAPERLFLPLDGYRGTMHPLVEPGRQVKKYQQVARSEGLFATCVHAPVSGLVKGTEEIEGRLFMVLQNDFKEEALLGHTSNPMEFSKEELLKALSEHGIEGSGGARFPTHLKYNIGGKVIDTLIVNAVECEPYLNADYALMRDRFDDLCKAIEAIQKHIRAKQIVFGMERHNRDLKALVTRKKDIGGAEVRVKLLRDAYPQGGELQLIKSVTGKELPKGSIPADEGVLVSNVGTLWAIYEALYEGKPYTERVVTVYAKKDGRRGNFRVKIGTPVRHILQQGGFKGDYRSYTVVVGGPMMGQSPQSLDFPIHKGTGGVLVLDKPNSKAFNYIGCGYCVDVCPQHLMPMEFVRSVQERNHEKLKGLHLRDCIECAACAYICPSEVPLMESIYEGKKII